MNASTLMGIPRQERQKIVQEWAIRAHCTVAEIITAALPSGYVLAEEELVDAACDFARGGGIISPHKFERLIKAVAAHDAAAEEKP